MVFKRTINIILLVLFISCNKSGKTYFPTGELESLFYVISDSCKQVEMYYKSGVLKAKGVLCDEKKDGVWEEFYEDGHTKWNGKYVLNNRVYPDTLNIGNIVLNSEYMDTNYKFQIDSVYKFQVHIDSVHPCDIGLAVSLGIVKRKDCGSFYLRPTKRGEMNIFIYVYINGEKFDIDNLKIQII